MDSFLYSKTGAYFSPESKYRYLLWRRWEEGAQYAMFIGLNPSTATEDEDDPTIRRCKRFARDWGYGAVVMSNLFALRSTKPRGILDHPDPVGMDNDIYLQIAASHAGVIVCAWGNHGSHFKRNLVCGVLLGDYKLKCLGTTKRGQPRHPLYVRSDKKLEDYTIIIR